MLIPWLALLLFPAPEAESGAIDAPAFGRLLRESQAPIRDVTFDFEGEFRPALEGPARGAAAPPEPLAYRGRYRFRSDGATLLHLFELWGDGARTHSLHVVSGASAESVSTVRGAPGLRRHSSPADPGFVSFSGSPQRFLYLWLLRPGKDYAGLNFRASGREVVDGRRCLAVTLDGERFGRAETPTRSRSVALWIDPERGGHPLRVDFRREGRLWSRADRIVLGQVPAPGGERVWLPLSGRFSNYDPEGVSPDLPSSVETYRVVPGSVRVNQGLPDSAFDFAQEVELEEDFAGPARARAEEAREELGRVKFRLDRALARLDERARRLDESWDPLPNPATLAVPGLVALAVLALAVVALRRAGRA